MYQIISILGYSLCALADSITIEGRTIEGVHIKQSSAFYYVRNPADGTIMNVEKSKVDPALVKTSEDTLDLKSRFDKRLEERQAQRAEVAAEAREAARTEAISQQDPNAGQLILEVGEQEHSGKLSPDLERRLLQPLAWPPVKFENKDLVAALAELGQRTGVKVAVDVKMLSEKERTWTVQAGPESTLIMLLEDQFRKQFADLEVIYMYDKVLVTTKEQAKANNLTRIHSNLVSAGPSEDGVKIGPGTEDQFYAASRPRPYKTNDASYCSTREEALQALASQFDRSLTWVAENMGKTNSVTQIHSNLVSARLSEDGLKAADRRAKEQLTAQNAATSKQQILDHLSTPGELSDLERQACRLYAAQNGVTVEQAEEWMKSGKVGLSEMDPDSRSQFLQGGQVNYAVVAAAQRTWKEGGYARKPREERRTGMLAIISFVRSECSNAAEQEATLDYIQYRIDGW